MRLLYLATATASMGFIAMACGDSPTFPGDDSAGPALAKGGLPGKPPPDAPPSSDIPVQLTGDYGGMYQDNGDILVGDVEVGGRLWMSQDPKRNETDLPKLCVILPDPIPPYNEGQLTEFEALAGPIGNEFCIDDFAIHTRDETEPGLYDMADGQTIMAGGKIALDEFSSKDGSWEWRLIFDTSKGNGDQSEYGKGVCVTRDDADTWRVYNGCSVDVGGVLEVVDSDIELWRVSRDVGWLHIANFDMPFSFTLSRVQ